MQVVNASEKVDVEEIMFDLEAETFILELILKYGHYIDVLDDIKQRALDNITDYQRQHLQDIFRYYRNDQLGCTYCFFGEQVPCVFGARRSSVNERRKHGWCAPGLTGPRCPCLVLSWVFLPVIEVYRKSLSFIGGEGDPPEGLRPAYPCPFNCSSAPRARTPQLRMIFDGKGLGKARPYLLDYNSILRRLALRKGGKACIRNIWQRLTSRFHMRKSD